MEERETEGRGGTEILKEEGGSLGKLEGWEREDGGRKGILEGQRREKRGSRRTTELWKREREDMKGQAEKGDEGGEGLNRRVCK